jgi:four helix bundle protein
VARIERFEELVAWQKARVLTQLIYQATQKERFLRDFGLSGQIQRAAVSMMSNVAEGFERGGRGEFHQFLSTAKASCAELRSQLYVAFDVGYLDQKEFDNLMARAAEVLKSSAGLELPSRGREAVKTETQSSILSPQSLSP